MKRFRPSGLAILATIFVLTGFGLMVASLRVESSRDTTATPEAAAVPVTIPATAPVAATATAGASQQKATKLFARAQAASRTVAYAGVKKVTRWNDGTATSVVVTVDHAPGHGTVVTQDDGTNAVNASNVAVETGEGDESATLSALITNYRLAAAGSDRMLGRDVAILDAYRADDSVAARFWIDDETGLVLRRELVGTDGKPTETSTYEHVEFGSAAVSTPTATPVPAWSVVSDEEIEQYRAAGWPIPQVLDGGQRLYQVREQPADAAGTRALQLSYTDGLAAMSVFIQQGALNYDAMTGYLPTTVAGGSVWVKAGSLFFVWHSVLTAPVAPTADAKLSPTRDIVVSVLADSPQAPVGSVLAVLPPSSATDDGVGDRLSRGVSRVGSWFDPLN